MLTRSRIWLIAPFVALFAFGVGFFFLWSYAGDEIETRLGAENITWKNVPSETPGSVWFASTRPVAKVHRTYIDGVGLVVGHLGFAI